MQPKRHYSTKSITAATWTQERLQLLMWAYPYMDNELVTALLNSLPGNSIAQNTVKMKASNLQIRKLIMDNGTKALDEHDDDYEDALESYSTIHTMMLERHAVAFDDAIEYD